MKSYLTADEAVLFYPQSTDYSPEQIQMALDASFSLVNSFLDSTIKLPAIDSRGTVPYILKVHQAKFFQYILEGTNIGYTDELKSLYESTAIQLRQITSNELIVSEIQITQQEIGWNLMEIKSAAGKVYVGGIAPLYNYSLRFICTTSGYPSETKWNVYRSDSDQVFTTVDGAFEWTAVTGSEIEFRLDGQFAVDDEFTVSGQPETSKVVSINKIIKQSEVYYG